MTLDDLIALEKAATPAPWSRLTETAKYIVNYQNNEELLLELRNAAPALLRVVKAAKAWHEEFRTDTLNKKISHYKRDLICQELHKSVTDLESKPIRPEGACT